MPIRKEFASYYKGDWVFLSLGLRYGRARGTCEWCGARDREILFSPLPSKPLPGMVPERKGYRIVLTVAHLDHNPTVHHPERLAVLCQACHNRWDADVRVFHRKFYSYSGRPLPGLSRNCIVPSRGEYVDGSEKKD